MGEKTVRAGVYCIPMIIGYDPEKYPSESVLKGLKIDHHLWEIIRNVIELSVEDRVEFVNVYPTISLASEVSSKQSEIIKTFYPDAEIETGDE